MRLPVRRLALATACSLATMAWASSPALAATPSAAPALSAIAGAGTPGFYRQPALRGDRLVFVAEGDLWISAAAGGPAQRLTTQAGAETFPALSPDGRWVAFVGQYESNGDVFVMPTSGGVPRRLTWDTGAVRVWGITAKNEVLFTGATDSGEPGTQLHLVDLNTGVRRSLPVGQASDGALSADGRTLYFTRNGLRGDNARQYRGGALARLWVVDLSGTAEARPLVAEGSNDRRPMPYTDASGAARVAFLSDRDGTYNLWSVKADGSDLRQHTTHKGWDVRHASIDGAQVAYALGADLYRIDLNATGAAAKLDLALGGDFDQQRTRWVSKPQDYLTQVALSPDGERALLTVRGRLATQGVGPLRRAELSVPAGLDNAGRCRDAEFSADSREVFALCDYSGEVEIWRFAANGSGQPRQLTTGATAMRQQLLPSPDGRWIAHVDKEGQLFLTDLKAPAGTAASALTRRVDQDVVGDGPQQLRWSPDGAALAYVRNTSNVYREQLMLLTVADGKVHQLSSDRYAAASPTFSPDGQWLYFLSRRSFSSSNPAPWGDRNMGPFFDKGWKVYALALQPGLRFPFAAPDELQSEKSREEAEVRDKEKDKPDDKESKQKVSAVAAAAAKPAPAGKSKPAIQIPGLSLRLYEVPLAAGNYTQLQAEAKRLYVIEGQTLKQLPIGPQENRADTVADGVQDFALSADGKKMLVRRAAGGGAPEILIVEAGPKLPGELDKARVRWSDWQIQVDPRAEWRQMFNDAWRMQRDHFYDKDMQGVDWAAMRTKYAPLAERVTERGELNEVLGQMVGELSLLHSQIAVGELRRGPENPGYAGFGALLLKDARGWKIDKLYAGDPELPSEAGPLAAPGLDIRPGTVITAINGRDATQVPDPSELLRGQAGKQVLLRLAEAGGRERSVIVTPVDFAREGQLRVNDWRYSRGKAVESAGGGRIGYLHLRAMGRNDIADFAREFYAQSDREGLIIDVRHNNGGNIDSWILQTLLRRAWAFWQPRSPNGGPVAPNMQQVFRGKVVVLANEETYSDGETFTEGFKQLGLGPVIGVTTSGAGVWLSDRNRLMDNGMMRAAETGQILAEGRFIVEGKGVTPDIRVDNPPRATANGQDAQLDAAIAWLKDAITKQPMVQPKPGPYPRPIKQ